MKKSAFSIFLLTVACLAAAPTLFARESGIAAPASLDPDLIKVLQKRYPGFRLAEKRDYCGFLRDEPEVLAYRRTKWSYGALKSDFNGDKEDDYAMIVRAKGRYLLLVALKTYDDPREAYRIKNFGQPHIGWRHTPEELWDRPEPEPHLKKGQVCDLLLVGPPGGLVKGFFKIPLNPYPYIHLVGDGEGWEIHWTNSEWKEVSYID